MPRRRAAQNPERIPAKRPAFDDWAAQSTAVETALSTHVRADAPASLDWRCYGVLDGGKRLRPLLVLAAAEAVGAMPKRAMRGQCGRAIHAYSLIHDMPCMGQRRAASRQAVTVHVEFGEAQAMPAGDAMQALAFEGADPAGRGRPRGKAAGAAGGGCAACWRGPPASRAWPAASDRPGQRVGRLLTEPQPQGYAPAQDRRAAAGQRDDGRGLVASCLDDAAALFGLRLGDRPGLPGGRRHS